MKRQALHWFSGWSDMSPDSLLSVSSVRNSRPVLACGRALSPVGPARKPRVATSDHDFACDRRGRCGTCWRVFKDLAS